MDASIRSAIKTEFWPRLVRELTAEKAEETLFDSKIHSGLPPVIFLPDSDKSTNVQRRYYVDAGVAVEILPNKANFRNDDFIQRISNRPGILALDFDRNSPLRYMVPGGRFNEFYGWDSYFIALGLLNDGKLDLAAAIADQFTFEIHNYGKILNANRPYYLGRTQPPFLTDSAWRVYRSSQKDAKIKEKFVKWIKAAITEHDEVWTSFPRYDSKTHLFKYVAQGHGIPPETEPGHFDSLLEPLAKKHNLTIPEFTERYNNRELTETDLDTYLLHDRSLRESGHDVSTRFINCCADLTTIDLASLLYKYEMDIFRAISSHPDEFSDCKNADWWLQRAKTTKEAANTYLWNSEAGFFCDYNVREQSWHLPLVSATIFWASWSNLASDVQAKSIRDKGLNALEFSGGIAATSKTKDIGCQWDYPAGWAPHQILAWEGLSNYGFEEDAKRIAQKWTKTIRNAAKQSDGALFEKYDVSGVESPQNLRAEYGNQGNNKTGFGWTNSSYAIAYDHYKN